MGRLPRAIDDVLVYRAIDRGNDRADGFADDPDYTAFLAALHTMVSAVGIVC